MIIFCKIGTEKSSYMHMQFKQLAGQLMIFFSWILCLTLVMKDPVVLMMLSSFARLRLCCFKLVQDLGFRFFDHKSKKINSNNEYINH